MADLLMKMPVPYEPKRKNRFILRFPSSLGINEWYVTSTARPSAKINATEIPFLNTSTYVAGRFTWDPIKVTFKDPIGPSASQALMGAKLASGLLGQKQPMPQLRQPQLQMTQTRPSGAVDYSGLLNLLSPRIASRNPNSLLG